MKNRFIKIFLLLIFISTLSYFFKDELFSRISSVRAFGELTVNFFVPPGDPIFNVTNMVPGETQSRNVDVTNGGTVARRVAVKGVRTVGVGGSPRLETILDIKISDGLNTLYGTGSPTGPKTVQDFFNDSSTSNGVQLNVITPSASKTYTFVVTFPQSAGNEFQAKSVIFDLTFGVITGDNVVINEVYYKVDSAHGLDSPKDRGIVSVSGNKVTIQILGNGPGSINTVTVNQSQACSILQSNNSTINNTVTVNSNTGGNTSSSNTSSSQTTTSGSIQSIVSIFNGGNVNSASGCGQKLGQNDEWVELFNPTDHDISLKNWSLTDNNSTTKINANKIIKSGGFAILSKSASTWTNWSENPQAIKVELGSNIGDGLDNGGDHIILKDSTSAEKDRMSWGSDTSGFTPPAVNPIVPLGSSTNRIVPGLDSNTVNDWGVNNFPNPGF